MKRRLLNLLTALSLLLCVAVCVLWVRSYWRYDLAGWDARSVAPILGSYRGHVLWAAEWGGEESRSGSLPRSDSDSGDDGPDDRRRFNYDNGPVDSDSEVVWNNLRRKAALSVAGFIYTFAADSTPPFRMVITPSWFVALLCAILPARRLWRSRTRRLRSRRGLCPACGYDLRATPGRCPECGREGPV